MMSDAYEMKDLHRSLLIRSRIYLLHNLRPTDLLWGNLIAWQVLSTDMVETIRSEKTSREMVAALLDMLPTRGPSAFDAFCEALIQCDHAHVAEYLKVTEATEHFRRDIAPHCSDFSDRAMERFVAIFRRNTPIVQRFTERKFEMILREQDRSLEEKETQLEQAAQERLLLELEVTKLRNFLGQCTQTTESLAEELQRQFLSERFVNEELRNLETLKSHLQGVEGCQQMCGFYDNMQVLLTYLLCSTGKQLEEKPGERHGEDAGRSQRDSPRRRQTLQEKLQRVTDNIVNIIDDRDELSQSLQVRLENVLERFSEVADDVLQVQHTLRQCLRHRRRFERESLSLIHSVGEMQRLQREVTEKQHHLIELSQQGQTMKRKTKHHRKLLQQIEQTMKTKHLELTQLQGTLAERSSSADQSMQVLLQLLPDLQDEVSNVTSTSETTPSLGSRMATHMSVVSSPERQEMLTGNAMYKADRPKLQDSGVFDVNNDKTAGLSVIDTLQVENGKSSNKVLKPTTTKINRKMAAALTSSEIDRWLAEQQAKSASQFMAKAHAQHATPARQLLSKAQPDEAKSDRKVITMAEPQEAKSARQTKEHTHEEKSDGQVKPHLKEAISTGQVMAKVEPQEANSADRIKAKRQTEREITINVPPTIIYQNDSVKIKPQAHHGQSPTPTPRNTSHPLSKSTHELRPLDDGMERLDNDVQDGRETNERTESGARAGRSTQCLHAVSTSVSRHKTRSLRTSSTKQPPLEDSTGEAMPNKVMHRRHLSRQTLPANKIQLRMPSQ